MDPRSERLSEQEVREVLEHLAQERNSPSVADVASAANVSEEEVMRALQKVRAEQAPAPRPIAEPFTPPPAPQPEYYEEYREVSYRRGGGMFSGQNAIAQIIGLIAFGIVALTIANGACAMQREMSKSPHERLIEMQEEMHRRPMPGF